MWCVFYHKKTSGQNDTIVRIDTQKGIKQN